jgi:Rrf2 family protein
MTAAVTSNGDGLRAVLRVSARADYAIRLVVAMAAKPDEVLPREQLAQSEGLPVKFVDHVLRQLRNGGLIESRRGRHGGYWLARPAELISLADVVHAMDESPTPRIGPADELAATPPSNWLVAVWTGVSDVLDAALADITVAALRDVRRDAETAGQGA